MKIMATFTLIFYVVAATMLVKLLPYLKAYNSCVVSENST